MRPLMEIGDEIQGCWKNVNFAAKPYLDAMRQLYTIDQDFYFDSGRSVVLYFLSNANGFRGPDARRIKAELKGMLDAQT